MEKPTPSPLLFSPNRDGTKFGKSESGNIWLDPKLTSAYQFFQFWLNADDRDMSRFLRIFSLKSHSEIEELEKNLDSDPRMVKQILAEELTSRIHSEKATQSVQSVSALLFDKKFKAEQLEMLSRDVLAMVAMEIPCQSISISLLGEKPTISELLTEHSNFFPSKSEVRRSIKGRALAVNKRKISDAEHKLDRHDLIAEKYILIESGKKKKFMVEAV
jgi:tyrosyl-tRNA synthetase